MGFLSRGYVKQRTPRSRLEMVVNNIFRAVKGIRNSTGTLLHSLVVRGMSSVAKSLVVFVLGGPGAGKGTQCERIVKEFGFMHLSAGDLLREARDSGSPDGKLIDDYIRNGEIVPVEITISLLQRAMEACPTKKFLIDGFPRNEDNLAGWEKQMEDKAEIKFVLFFDCPEEVCLDRAMKRGQSSGRKDDNPEAFVKRYRTYVTSTMPIIEKYQKLGLVRKIMATPGPDEVFEDVKRHFQEL